MAEPLNEDDWHRQIARRLARLFNVQMGRALELAEEFEDLAGFSSEALEEIRAISERELTPALMRELEQIFEEQAAQMLGELPVGVEFGLINERAADWAADYTFDLVSGINQTTMQTLRKKIQRFFEMEEMTIGDLRDSLQSTFGPVRADMIAQTETTRAAVEGALAVRAEIEKQGLKMRGTWQTSNDERVCPICGPLHGTKEEDNGGYRHPDGTIYQKPPAHVRCRCWVNHELERTS